MRFYKHMVADLDPEELKRFDEELLPTATP